MKIRILLRWIPAAIVMAIIFAMSSTPSQELPHFGLWDTLVKKGGHFFGYAILALAYWYGLSGQSKLRPYFLAFVLAILYAISDEYHQSFVPGRHPSWVDAFVIDGSGAALMLIGIWRYRTRKTARRAQSTRP
jgi:VanZ family protein